MFAHSLRFYNEEILLRVYPTPGRCIYNRIKIQIEKFLVLTLVFRNKYIGY